MLRCVGCGVHDLLVADIFVLVWVVLMRQVLLVAARSC